MKNPTLRTSRGQAEALQNLLYNNRCTIADIEDVVEDSRSGEELVTKINKLNLLRKFTLDRETETKVRLKSIDALGNVSYFETEK